MNFSHQCCPLLNQIAAESSFYKSTPHDGYNVHADHLALFSLLLLRDESRIDPEDAEIAEVAESVGQPPATLEDEFDA